MGNRPKFCYDKINHTYSSFMWVVLMSLLVNKNSSSQTKHLLQNQNLLLFDFTDWLTCLNRAGAKAGICRICLTHYNLNVVLCIHHVWNHGLFIMWHLSNNRNNLDIACVEIASLMAVAKIYYLNQPVSSWTWNLSNMCQFNVMAVSM